MTHALAQALLLSTSTLLGLTIIFIAERNRRSLS